MEYQGGAHAVLDSDGLELAISLSQVERMVIMEKIDMYLKTHVERKEIPEINEVIARGVYSVLGPTEGTSFFHCWYMAVKFCEGFYEKVTAYAITKSKMGSNAAIIFYGDKLPAN